jgi:hypothetical protein
MKTNTVLGAGVGEGTVLMAIVKLLVGTDPPPL